MTELVSIVIPVYNYGQYLGEAIESALSQTYEHVEVLVVDDGSTDHSGEVAAGYGERIRYLYKPNGGLSSARNHGIRHASGDYVVFLDADNRLDEHYVERTATHLAAQPSSVGYVYTQMTEFEAGTRVSQFPGFTVEYLRVHNVADACCLFRASVLAARTYDSRFTAWEDWDFYLGLAEEGIVGALLNEPLFYYRLHDDGMSMLDRMSRTEMVRNLRLLRRKHWRLYGASDTVLFFARSYLSRG